MKREQSSLAILVKALEGISTTIELRNETEITGQIENVDWMMKYSTPAKLNLEILWKEIGSCQT